MKQFGYIIWVVLIGISILCIYYMITNDSNKQSNYIDVRIDTIVVVDTFTLPPPKPQIIIKREIPPAIDTMAILSAYFEKRIFNDTIINNENLIVEVKDTITENQIQSRKINYSLLYPEITRTLKPRNRLSIHADTRGSIYLQLQRDRYLFSGGYDIVNKTPMIGLGINIFEK